MWAQREQTVFLYEMQPRVKQASHVASEKSCVRLGWAHVWQKYSTKQDRSYLVSVLLMGTALCILRETGCLSWIERSLMLFGSDPNFLTVRSRTSLDSSQGIFPSQYYLCHCDILSSREECVIKSAVTNYVCGDRDDTNAESTSSPGHRSLMFLPIYTAVVAEASHTVPSATWDNASTNGIPHGFPRAATSPLVTRNSIYQV